LLTNSLTESTGVVLGYQSFMQDEAPMESVDFACGLGLGLIELNANMPWFFPEKFDARSRAALHDRASEAGIILAIHAPEEISLASPHPPLLKAGVERMKEFIRLAGDIGADVLTCHIGGNYLHWATGDDKVLRPQELYGEQMKESILSSLPHLAREAQEAGVKLSLENAGYFGPEVVQETISEVMAQSPLHLTWDVGHTNLRTGIQQRQEEFILSRLDRVAFFHLHDNDGSRDAHGVLGSGTVDLARAIGFARQAGAPVSIEVRPRALIPECVEALFKAIG
jgi:sugar phosphate isomerase/epimerase